MVVGRRDTWFVSALKDEGRRQNQNEGRQKGRNNDDQGKTDTTPVTSDKTPGSVGVHKLAPEAGIFIILWNPVSRTDP
jgi:hypothetical protein